MSLYFKITIIILNWNGKEDTLECLTSIQQIDYPHYSVIVADNGSTDDSVAVIREAFPDIVVLENGENLGFAEGNNRAIRYALDNGADAVLLLNNDTIVDAHLLNAFAEAFRALPDAAMLGAVSFYYDQPEIIWAAGGHWDPSILDLKHTAQGQTIVELPSQKTPYEVDYVIGCALFVHRAVIEHIGLMEPLFFLNFEENDWCQRAKQSGFKNYTVPEAKIWHKVSASFGGESALWKYYMTRNLLLWSKRHLSAREHRRVFFKTVKEFFPYFPSKLSGVKPRYWALQTWWRQCSIRLTEPFYVAHLYGIYHYLIQRFGQCPAPLQAKISPLNSPEAD